MIIRSFLLLTLVSYGSEAAKCKYINQDTSSVIIDKNVDSVTSSNGGTQTLEINEGESLSVRCVNSAKQAFSYGTQTDFTCSTGGSTESLPFCVDKCNKLVDIKDPNSVFLDGSGADVSNTTLASYTPITIKCNAPYAQMYAQQPSLLCDSWTDDALCKKMCQLSSYDASYTDLKSTGIEEEGGVKYLKVGFSISIDCRGGYSLPDGAVSSVKCEEGDAGATINIPSCRETCKVPVNPANTLYHATQGILNEGQTFTVSCTDGFKLPYYTKSEEVACKDDGSFEEIPQCKETCSISPGGDSTVLNKTVTGNLAQDEAVEVSCKNTDWLLPYGTPTPWIIVCTDKQDFSIPVCQPTCKVPTKPPNAVLVRVGTGPHLSLREPINAKCMDYYSYEKGTEVETFFCSDSSRSAAVNIDIFCYVYAKITYKSGGTYKLAITGEIVDGDDHSADGTTIEMRITGSIANITKTDILPNSPVVVDVQRYEPLSVVLITTSMVDSQSRVISRDVSDIYPGPPSAKLEQKSSTSLSVDIMLSGDSTLDNIPTDQLVEYTISYTNKGSPISIDVPDGKSAVILPNLDPATAFSVAVTTTLTERYGGKGSPSFYTVYTGPSPVAALLFTVKEKIVVISWSLIDEATKYEVSIFDNGNKFVSKTTPGVNVTIINLDAGKTYKVKIVTCRSVDVDGKTVEFLGDAFEKDLLSAPLSPKASLFDITNTSSSVTITRVSKGIAKRQASDLEYIVFLNDAAHKFPADAVQLTLSDLQLSTDYKIEIAEAVGADGYGMRTSLETIKTADCGMMKCVNCNADSAALFSYVWTDTYVVATCIDEYRIKEKNALGETVHLSEKSLYCNNKNQYIYVDEENRNQIFEGPIECTKQEAVVIITRSYTMYYIIGGVLVFVVLVIIILMIVLRRRRIQGTYNAKKVNETSKNGTISHDNTPNARSFVQENAYFENKMDMELMRNQSTRSKATSYGSQELRMELADSDSGITEDLETYFNPAAFHSRYDDDTVSTKSALV